MHAVRPASGTRRRLRLDRDERGNFMIELGVALPVLLVLLLVGIELTRFVLVNQKVERTSASLADLCEAFFRYEPVVFQKIIKQTTVQRFAVFRPRYGSLDVIYR